MKRPTQFFTAAYRHFLTHAGNRCYTKRSRKSAKSNTQVYLKPYKSIQQVAWFYMPFERGTNAIASLSGASYFYNYWFSKKFKSKVAFSRIWAYYETIKLVKNEKQD